MDLTACDHCRGLAPTHVDHCPHCDAPRSPATPPGRRSLSRAVQALGGGAIAMTLMACYGAPPGRYPPPAPLDEGCTSMSEDVDGDGFCAEDCDEVRADIHPGAEDPPGDGYDQNCDGIDGIQGIDGGSGAPTGQAEPPTRTLATDPEDAPNVVVEPEP